MKSRQSFAILPLLLTLSVSGNAATRTWDYGISTANWADATNWDTDIVPAAGDTVNLTTTGNTPATINLNSTYRDSTNPLYLNLAYGKDLTISGATNAEFYLRDLTVTDAFTYTLNVPRGSDANSGTMPYNGATWNIGTGGTLLVKSGFGTKSGVGSGSFNKDGLGTLRLGDGSAGNAVGQYLSLNARGGLTELGFITTGNAANGISGIASGATVKIAAGLTTQTWLANATYMNQTGISGVAGTFDLNGFPQRIVALGGTSTGLVANNGATDSTLTIGVNGLANTRNETSSTFAGVLADGPTNKLSLVVNSLNSAFVQALSGANTYTGTTTVSKGTLAIAGGSIANSAVTLNGSGRLATGTTLLNHQNLTLPSLTQLDSSAIDLDLAGATADKVTVSDTYNATGGTVEVNVASRPTGPSYEILTYGALTGTPVVNVNGLTNSRISAGTPVVGANAVTLSFSGSVADLVWTGAASNDWALADSVNNFTNGGTPDVFKTFDNVLFDNSTTFNSPLLVGTLTAGTVTFAGNSDYTLAGSGSLAGGTAIVKNGDHTLTIANTGTNTFAGAVTINGGTLKAGTTTPLGAATGATTVNTGGTLDINAKNLGSEPVILAGGTLNNDGADQTQALTNLTVSASSTIGGLGRWDVRGATAVATVNSGAVLTKEDTNIVWLGVLAGSQLVNNGQIVANAGQVGVSNSTVSGSGSFRANAGGTIQIETPVANPLPVTLNGGILGLTTANANQNAAVTLLADSAINATPALNANATTPNTVFTTVSGNIIESGGAFKLTKTGGGALAVSGAANNWTGGTVVNGGILQANANQCLGTGAIIVGTSDLGAVTHSLRPNGVTLDNNIELNYQYTVDYKGAITAVGGVTSTLDGTVTVKPPVNATRRGGDLASDATPGSVLRLMGKLNAGGGLTNIVQRDGTVEYGGGSDTVHLLTITGTGRLAADNGIGSGVLVRVGAGTLDMNGHTSLLAGLESNSTAAIVTNNGTADATLTVSTPASPPIITTPALTGIFTGTMQDGPTHKTNFVKDGPGTLTRTGSNTHSGSTTVVAGTLAGTGSNNSPLAVHPGATVAPGSGIGSFGCASADFQAGSTLAAQIDSSQGLADKLDAYGNINLAVTGAGVSLMPTDAAASPAVLTVGTVLVIADYSGNTLTGAFAGLSEGEEITVGLNKFLLSYNNGSKITLTANGAAGGYTAWAAANANNEAASGDYDKDGTSNGIEYFMGQTGSTFTSRPPVVTANGIRTITWPKNPAFVGTYVVKTSADLSVWTAVTGGVTGTVADNGTSVVYTFPAGSGSRFARLEVTAP